MAPNTYRTYHLINIVALIAFPLLPPSASAKDPNIMIAENPQALAFSRYIASVEERNPFTESGPVAVVIEASLPKLYKQTRLLAIRQTDETEHSRYQLVRIEGDATVAEEVISRYFKAQEHIDDLPVRSMAITPANYKFRYVGRAGSGAAAALIYSISPKKKSEGLIQGRLWIDAVTGMPVLQTGYLVKTPAAFIGRMEVVRDTKIVNGTPLMRVTHVSLRTRAVGRGELTITEIPLGQSDEAPTPIPNPTLTLFDVK